MSSSTSRSVTDANMVANGNPSFPLSEETLNNNNNNNNKRPSQQYANPNPNESSVKKRKFHSSHSPHSQTGPSQYSSGGHGVGGGRHLPSHSSGPVISNVPVTVGATSVVRPSSSVTAQTPLPKPAQVSLPPLLPTGMAFCEICKVQCDTPRMLELHKNTKKHLKKMMVETSEPMETVSFTCELCNVKINSLVDYQNHITGMKHLVRLRSIGERQISSGVGLQVDNDTTMKKEGTDGGRKYMRTNDGSESVEEPAETPFSLICGLCNFKCGSEASYQCHINGKRHLTREGNFNSSLALSEGIQNAKSGGFLGLKALDPPDINALSNAIDARVRQGGANDPEVLFGQLLMMVLSKRQVAIKSQVKHTRAARLPAPTSIGRQSNKPQLSRTQVSKDTAHVEKQNPSREIKTELLCVPLGSNIQPGSSVSTQNEGGGSKTDDGSKPIEPAHVSQSHVTGKQHLSQLKRAHDPQALSGTGQQQALSGARVGLQALYPPDSNALSNAINAQVQQGDNDPQVLLAQRLMNVICQAQAPPAAGTGTTAALIPPSISMAIPSYQPQLPPADASIINHSTYSSIITQIEGGDSETKQQV